MSSKTMLESRQKRANVTLDPPDPPINPFTDKKFPCCLCGNDLEIRFSKKNKPYTTCFDCGIQTFFRGKKGIQQLKETIHSEILVAEKGSHTELAFILFSRIQRLQNQKKQLTEKQGVIIRDPDLDNAICVVENEIKYIQQELAKLADQKKDREDIQ
jgi:hypothetical protein